MITKTGLIPAETTSLSTDKKAGNGAFDVSKQFGQFFDEAMQTLNNQQAKVEDLTQKMITGDLGDVSQLMIATQKATLGLELTVQVRNKVIDAYQEIMRMQV